MDDFNILKLKKKGLGYKKRHIFIDIKAGTLSVFKNRGTRLSQSPSQQRRLSIAESFTLEDDEDDADEAHSHSPSIHLPSGSWSLSPLPSSSSSSSSPSSTTTTAFVVFLTNLPFSKAKNNSFTFKILSKKQGLGLILNSAKFLGALEKCWGLSRMPLSLGKISNARVNGNGENEFRIKDVAGFRRLSEGGLFDDAGEGREVWRTHPQLLSLMKLPTPPSTTTSLLYRNGLDNYEELLPTLIATLKVEVLQCTGLPKLDPLSLTDPYVLVIYNGQTFRTSVCADCCSPVWLPHDRRAVLFPVRDEFSKLYVGVWDDDGEGQKDDFAGRWAVDVGRKVHAAHNSKSVSWEVEGQLRTSCVAYSRAARGVVRLRLTVTPSTTATKPPSILKPFTPSSIPTALLTPKSTRIICYTLYGRNLPSVYSDSTLDAVGRELDMYVEMGGWGAKEWAKKVRGWEGGARGFCFSLSIWGVVCWCSVGGGGFSQFLSILMLSVAVKICLLGLGKNESSLKEFPMSELSHKGYGRMSFEECCKTDNKLGLDKDDLHENEEEEGEELLHEEELTKGKQKGAHPYPVRPYHWVEQDIAKPKSFVVPLEDKIARMKSAANAVTLQQLETQIMSQKRGFTPIPIHNLYLALVHKSTNPLFRLKAKFAAPVQIALEIIVNAVRCGTHIVEWKDERVSWAVVGGLVVGAGLMWICDWGKLMLVVGTLVVGPQNFLLRVFRGKGGGGGEEEEEAGEEKGEKGDKCKEKNKNEKAYIVMPDRKLDTTRFNETPLKEEIVEW